MRWHRTLLRFLVGLGLSSGHMAALTVELGAQLGEDRGSFLGRTHAKVSGNLLGFQLSCARGRRGSLPPPLLLPKAA